MPGTCLNWLWPVLIQVIGMMGAASHVVSRSCWLVHFAMSFEVRCVACFRNIGWYDIQVPQYLKWTPEFDVITHLFWGNWGSSLGTRHGNQCLCVCLIADIMREKVVSTIQHALITQLIITKVYHLIRLLSVWCYGNVLPQRPFENRFVKDGWGPTYSLCSLKVHGTEGTSQEFN